MTVSTAAVDARVEQLDVSAYTIPTDYPGSDGTAIWTATTMVLVEAHAAGKTGLGWTYGDVASGIVIESTLREIVAGSDAMRFTATWQEMLGACRNLGRPGVPSMAIAAVDTALWDLKARLLELPLATLLDAAHEAVPIYGSGGLTSLSGRPAARADDRMRRSGP